eukprot:EC835555.1.p3 GENE.EC835555.1~~EC835555.1.p3  ORF type:complete len:109 (-),score=3.70 EC835555.1:146-472(-)
MANLRKGSLELNHNPPLPTPRSHKEVGPKSVVGGWRRGGTALATGAILGEAHISAKISDHCLEEGQGSSKGLLAGVFQLAHFLHLTERQADQPHRIALKEAPFAEVAE